MKKIYPIVLIGFLALLLISCSSSRTSGDKAPAKSYTEAEEIQTLEYNTTLGFSPDGELFLPIANNTIQVLNLEKEDVENTIDADKSVLAGKKALWSKSGDSFILGDSFYTPRELVLMRSENIRRFTLDEDKGKRITREDVETGFIKGGALIYSPSWSADGKSVIYSVINDEEVRVVKADLESGDTEVLYDTHDRSDCTQAVELTDGLLLCEVNGNKAGDNEIFLYDVKKDEETELEDVIDENRDDRWAIYEIKDLSEDRRAVLINKYISLHNEMRGSMALAKCIILKFDQRFKSYTVETISFGITADGEVESEYNSELIWDDAPNRLGYSATLSPDGSFIVTREDEISEGNVTESKRQLVLHNLNTGKQHILYEADEPEVFGIGSPLNGNCEPIFINKNGLMAVWFVDGYRIFELK